MYNLIQYKSRANTILQKCKEIEDLQEQRIVKEKSEYYVFFGTEKEKARDLREIDKQIELNLNILKCLV